MSSAAVPVPQEGFKTQGKSRRMLRCECAGVSFAEVALALRGGQSLGGVCERTGCGRTCSACLPDLQDYVERHVSPRP